ncbi:hypothetical protein BH20ACI2_BH20ACI2_11210 [soil metagenome]
MKLNRKFAFTALIGLLLAVCSSAVAAMNQAESAPMAVKLLKPGRPVSRSMAGKSRHIYMVRLKKGMFLGLTVDQRDVDVTTEVIAPDSTSLGKFDAPTSERGVESVRIGADVPGEYRIEVFTASELAGPGRYTIKIKEMRKATKRDAQILKAAGLLQEAIRLRMKPETRKDAIPVYERAAYIWRKLRLPADEASALRAIAFVYQREDEIDKAREYFGKALEIWERIGDTRSAAFTHVIYGVYSRRQKDFRAALAHDLRARKLWLKANDRPEQTHNLVQIGDDYLSLGERTRAFKSFQQGLDLIRRIGRKSIEAQVLNKYGDAHAKVGNKAEALKMYRRSVELWKLFNQDNIAAGVEKKIAKLSTD